jgi:protein-S-isoprenylcysteine O-methyltransferase Ste14
MLPDPAVDILWFVWYVSWIAAVVWSAKTKVQMRTDRCAVYRFVFTLGLFFLFVPVGAKPAPSLAPYTQALWREPAWMEWALFALVAACFGFCWWARVHLGRLWSGYVTLKEDHRIVDTGPYALVRHPIYSGIIAASLVTALMKADAAALAGFALVTLGLFLTARVEERFLRAQLGADAYDSYRTRVAMLVPMM